ncbi:glycosyltransferase [Pedobacter endophyticus]|uniref:Glycosyltransferase n=1 Tax=Pedobacter endophyticus TaxID=2789740 RepID=A0A7U3SP88_9SPHI|nr:glycosyltransferase [Pedobacter endophyticus]QPH38358.1 glycosyltransferase [Pedobacter endophyticus]
MKILQTVKYYEPSKGGMESVVKDIVSSISTKHKDVKFTVYSNNHTRLLNRNIDSVNNITLIKERTPFIFKSQPLNIKYRSLTKLIADNEIIHHHYPFPNMELALIRNIELLRQRKLIITWHANIKSSRWSWIGKFYDPIIKRLLDIAQHIVVTSPQLLENSDLLLQYKDKVTVIPLSFDPALSLNVLPKKYPFNRNIKLLFVGKLREYKGIKYLIDAVKELNVNLTIVGDGENATSLAKQVEILNIESKVEFKSNLSNEDLGKCYLDSDIFVLPSINEAEAFGVVQLEAMANALPVINTNLKSGVPYVSLAGITGETVNPADSNELRLAIENLISQPQLFEKYSANAVRRVEMFSRSKLAENYLKLYSSESVK